MLGYVARSLQRNPKRALAAVAGVALAFALFADAAFFVDGSGRQMTRRAIAHVTIDMQAGVNESTASSLSLTTSISPRPPLAPGLESVLTLVATNTGSLPANGVVVEAPLPPQLGYVLNSTRRDGAVVPDVLPPVEPPPEEPPPEGTPPPPPPPPPAPPLEAGLTIGTLAPGAAATITYQATVKVAVATAADVLGASIRSAEEPVSGRAPTAPPPSTCPAWRRPCGTSPRCRRPSRSDWPTCRRARSPRARPCSTCRSRWWRSTPDYARDIPLVGFPSGEFVPGTAFLSPAVAQRLGAAVGAPLRRAHPGHARDVGPLPAGERHRRPGRAPTSWFASRVEDVPGDFVSAPMSSASTWPRSSSTCCPPSGSTCAAPVPAWPSLRCSRSTPSCRRDLLSENPRLARRTTTGVRRTDRADRARRPDGHRQPHRRPRQGPGRQHPGHHPVHGPRAARRPPGRLPGLLRREASWPSRSGGSGPCCGPAASRRRPSPGPSPTRRRASPCWAAPSAWPWPWPRRPPSYPADVEPGDPTLRHRCRSGGGDPHHRPRHLPSRPGGRCSATSPRPARRSSPPSAPAGCGSASTCVLLAVAAVISLAFVVTGGFKPKASARSRTAWPCPSTPARPVVPVAGRRPFSSAGVSSPSADGWPGPPPPTSATTSCAAPCAAASPAARGSWPRDW